MDKTVKFLTNYEGRDKMCKMIQYLSRFIMHHTGSVAFKNLFTTMKDSRKLFRLFKSLIEIKKIQNILSKPPANANEFELILSKIKSVRSSCCFFWLLAF